ncbi:MAG: DNA primase [Kiritimatiellia bacterium]
MFGEREEVREGERLYDRFRNRLMFPILDEQTRVIGFSGRIIPPSEVKAKYLNSPETLLFKKSRVLYGIDKARQAMTEKRRAVLCEGQLDVIRCHECGIGEAVAAQGTAVTEEHARILKRYADEVILLLDADAAGIKAALRSADVLLAEGIITRVASLPAGKDPDDVVRSSGAARLREIVEEADPFVVFQVRTLVQAEGEITETSRMRVARKVMESLVGVKEAVHREEMLRQAAGALGMREDTLRQDLQSMVPRSEPSPLRPSSPRQNFRSAPAPTPPKNQDPLPPAERTLLEILWTQPSLIPEAKSYLIPEQLSSPEGQELLAAMYEVRTFTHSGILDTLREHPTGQKLIKLDQERQLQFSGELGTAEEALDEIILVLRRMDIQRKRQRLNERIAPGEGETASELESEIFKLFTHESQLKNYLSLKDWEKGKLLLSIIDQQ